VYESGGRQSLQIVFNVLSNDCGGCQYESYPYKAQLPVVIDGKRPIKEFKSDDDFWEVVDLVIKDTEDFNLAKGKTFDICESVVAQIPFFGCTQKLLDRDIQSDIKRYVYCEKFNTSPYKGDYGEQPCLWVEKAFLIRKYFAKLESNQINKAKANGTRKN
tara:strand:+ start:1090 stop:1569 length:480 start_codon:yes stop_codon:yes gene_type:complete